VCRPLVPPLSLVLTQTALGSVGHLLAKGPGLSLECRLGVPLCTTAPVSSLLLRTRGPRAAVPCRGALPVLVQDPSSSTLSLVLQTATLNSVSHLLLKGQELC
jgi:hypothetical protein